MSGQIRQKDKNVFILKWQDDNDNFHIYALPYVL